MRSGALESAPLWAVFCGVVAVLGGLAILGMRARGSRSGTAADAVRRTARVDGWLHPAVTCPRPDRPEGPPDGVLLRGWIANRTTGPVWDLLAEVVDPGTGRTLPLVPLSRHVLPPGGDWSLEWVAGCTVTPPEPDVIDLSGPAPAHSTGTGHAADRDHEAGSERDGEAAQPPPCTAPPCEAAPLPVPAVLAEAGSLRPQLRITFSDTSGRWTRQGAWLAPATREPRPIPGSTALSRAFDEFRDAATEDRPLDTARVAIEVGFAVHEVARHRLGRFSEGALDLTALPGLLTHHPLARRLRFEPGTALPPEPRPVPGSAPAPSRAGRPADDAARRPTAALATLAAAVRHLDERIGTAAGDRSSSAARLLLAQAGSVLTALNALRLAPEPAPAPHPEVTADAAGPGRGSPTGAPADATTASARGRTAGVPIGG